MAQKGSITKTEIFLLLLTALFAALLLVMYFAGRGGAEGTYTVTTQRGEGAEEITVQKVNVNTADLETLQTLEGIGPVLAQRILTLRQSGVVFKAPEDLLQVQGIGEHTLEQIRDFIITEEIHENSGS